MAVFTAAAPGSPAPSPGARPSPDLPAWKDEIAQGFLPYHQLTAADFPASDSADNEKGFFVKPFIDPRYQGLLHSNRGWVHAYVKQWQVFSGLDRMATYRNRRFRDMKASLPYAQAILDLNELHARRLAVVPPDGFPECRAGTEKEAVAGLQEKINLLCQKVYDDLNCETDAFAKATDNGQNKEKTRKLAAEISERLQAMSAPTPFGLPLPLSASLSPSASPSPFSTTSRAPTTAPDSHSDLTTSVPSTLNPH